MPTETGVSRRPGLPQGGRTREHAGRVYSAPHDEPADLSRRLPGLSLGGERPRPGLGGRRAGEPGPHHHRPPRGRGAPRAPMARQARRGPDLLVRRARRADRPLRQRAAGARGGAGRPGRGLPAPRPRDADRDDRHLEGRRGLRADLHRVRPGRGGVPGPPQRGPGPDHAPRASRAPARARAGRRDGRHGRRARRGRAGRHRVLARDGSADGRWPPRSRAGATSRRCCCTPPARPGRRRA